MITDNVIRSATLNPGGQSSVEVNNDDLKKVFETIYDSKIFTSSSTQFIN